MPKIEIDRPFKLNLNSLILIVQLVFAGGAAAAFFSNSYADYRRDAETIAALKLQVVELQKADRDFGGKLADSQFATATKLVGIERDVDYIKKTVERLEKAVTPR
ncbi:MAG: hypothetical protein WBB98_10815 [Xanthobacteraceae bacterium]